MGSNFLNEDYQWVGQWHALWVGHNLSGKERGAGQHRGNVNSKNKDEYVSSVFSVLLVVL